MSRSQLTKDLNESVKSLLGKKVKILFKNVVKLETKPDKTENRVLVFSPCRLFLLISKVPTRIDCHCHYLHIQAIESKRLNQISLTLNEKVYTFITNEECGGQEVDAMLHALYTAIRNIFPTVPLTYIIRKIDVIPKERVQYLEDDNRICREPRGIGPCGGFSTQYACMCDYHMLPFREEVAWDVDTIYLSHDVRELSLRDFDYLDPKDLIPIISAIEYNTWFTKLRTSHIKLGHDAIDRIIHVMKKSLSIEELYLDNSGLKWDFVNKLCASLVANKNTLLHTIDISNNLIEDKGAASLCTFISKVAQGATCENAVSKVQKGLVHLNVAHCSVTSKGVSHLSQALLTNKCIFNTLTYLNLSENNLKDDVTNLCNFLAQPNVITHLDISKTDCLLETIFGALLRGCATNLVHLNVSHNLFNTKKGKELPPSFKQFFTSSIALKYVNMSYCKPPLDALKNLLLGLACNETVADVTLDISCNNLGPQGAHVLESCIQGVRSVSTIDITDSNMDSDLSSVITSIGKNKFIKNVYMGRNMNNMKAKHISSVMEALVQLIQDEDCTLETLAIPECKLKSDLYNLINALGGNQSLLTLDITGNMIGDGGARLLGKALQVNSHLRSITYDRNNITLQGYSDLSYGLKSNYVMRYMPVPLLDIGACMKISSERTEKVMKSIQEILHRNVSPKRYSNGHGYRLQQGFLLSSTQQMVDKLIAQTKEVISATMDDEKDDVKEYNEDINYAERLIQDADHSKHLLPYLQEVIQKNEESGNSVDLKLQHISNELHSTVVKYLNDTMESILAVAEDECPSIFDNDAFMCELRDTATGKNFLQPDVVYSCIVEYAGTQIMNKINDLNLAVAAHVSDKVTDEIIESLSRCYRALAGNCKRRSSTPDVLRSMSGFSSGSSRIEQSESFNSQRSSDRSPIATPHLTSKRKSLHGRKLRPKSVVDSVEGMSADDIPDLLPSLASSTEESLDSVSELPKSLSQQLQHLAKGRPKRAKTRATSRSHLRSNEEKDNNVILESFFKSGSTTSSATATPMLSPSSDDSSVSSIMTDVSPNQSSSNLPELKLNYPPSKNSTDNIKSNHNSLPKKSHLLDLTDTTTFRSKSSDNLAKFSHSSSPLAKRIANFENVECDITEDGRRKNASQTDTQYSTRERTYSTSVMTSSCNFDLQQNTKLRTTSTTTTTCSESSGSVSMDIPSSPVITPKPRRWSMLDNGNDRSGDCKGGETSGITTSSLSEPSPEPDNQPEKKSVRELAASLVKQSKESPDNTRKTDSRFSFMKLRNAVLPTSFNNTDK